MKKLTATVKYIPFLILSIGILPELAPTGFDCVWYFFLFLEIMGLIKKIF